MRYCLGYVNRPTDDGRLIARPGLTLPAVAPVVRDGAVVGQARAFRLVGREIRCAADVSVGSGEALGMDLEPPTVLEVTPWGITVLRGRLWALTLHTGPLAWRQLQGRQRR